MQTNNTLDIDHPAIELLSYYIGLLNPVQDTLENLYRLSFEEGRFGNSEWSSTLAQGLSNMEVVLISMEMLYADFRGEPPENLILHAVRKRQVQENQSPEVLF